MYKRQVVKVRKFYVMDIFQVNLKYLLIKKKFYAILTSVLYIMMYKKSGDVYKRQNLLSVDNLHYRLQFTSHCFTISTHVFLLLLLKSLQIKITKNKMVVSETCRTEIRVLQLIR